MDLIIYGIIEHFLCIENLESLRMAGITTITNLRETCLLAMERRSHEWTG
jgi:hypothetical protein